MGKLNCTPLQWGAQLSLSIAQAFLSVRIQQVEPQYVEDIRDLVTRDFGLVLSQECCLE